ECGDVARNREGEVRRARVELRTATRLTADQALAGGWEVVVCCTGARPDRPAPEVLSVWDVMRDEPIGARVAVVDQVGFHQATSTAALLAQRGHRGEVLPAPAGAGPGLGLTLDLENSHTRVLGTVVRMVA